MCRFVPLTIIDQYLLNHLVGGGEQFVGHCEAEHPGGRVVYDQLELARLHHRQIRGLGALEKAAAAAARCKNCRRGSFMVLLL